MKGMTIGMIDIDDYDLPFTPCVCGCGCAVDARGRQVVPKMWRNGDDLPSFEEVMRVVAEEGCQCGSWSTYGKGGAGHADYCREYNK